MTISELCERNVINITSGTNLGSVNDIVFDEKNAQITHIIIYGRLKFFGILGREDDTYIPWADIKKIGIDVLLVDTDLNKLPKHENNTARHSILFG